MIAARAVSVEDTIMLHYFQLKVKWDYRDVKCASNLKSSLPLHPSATGACNGSACRHGVCSVPTSF